MTKKTKATAEELVSSYTTTALNMDKALAQAKAMSTKTTTSGSASSSSTTPWSATIPPVGKAFTTLIEESKQLVQNYHESKGSETTRKRNYSEMKESKSSL